MTGTINPRKPQPISLISEEEAYNLLNDDDASFDPEEDIADRDTAEHVHNALLRMLGEANEEEMKIKVQYEENWINTTMNSISNRWDI